MGSRRSRRPIASRAFECQPRTPLHSLHRAREGDVRAAGHETFHVKHGVPRRQLARPIDGMSATARSGVTLTAPSDARPPDRHERLSSAGAAFLISIMTSRREGGADGRYSAEALGATPTPAWRCGAPWSVNPPHHRRPNYLSHRRSDGVDVHADSRCQVGKVEPTSASNRDRCRAAADGAHESRSTRGRGQRSQTRPYEGRS